MYRGTCESEVRPSVGSGRVGPLPSHRQRSTVHISCKKSESEPDLHLLNDGART